MILGIGTDIVALARIEKILTEKGDALARRVLTDSEFCRFQSHHNPAAYLAKRFAAKEAMVKALGTGFAKGIGFKQIETVNTPLGAPQMRLQGKALEHAEALGVKSVHLSLSDEKDNVIAFVVIEG